MWTACGTCLHTCVHVRYYCAAQKIPINNLCVNPAKSKFMYFSLGSQSSFDLIPPFNLGNKAIERVYSYKYLNWTYLFLHSLMVSTHHPKLITSKAKCLLHLIYHQSTVILTLPLYNKQLSASIIWINYLGLFLIYFYNVYFGRKSSALCYENYI